MPSNNKQYKPLKDWQEFERFCHTLWGEILNDPNIQLNGRGGQEQHGVDIYGHSSDDVFTCIQCKGKDANYGNAVTERELRSEVEKAKKFKPSPPDVFILATTAPNDEKIQEVARQIEEENKKLGLFNPTDLKMCALIKLGFSSKEMADLMSIGVPGINTSRYRIRKKMDLSGDVNLTEFLREI